MTEYIDRQAAIDALGEEPEIWCETDEEAATRNQWERDKVAIEAVPPADVRPVVRGHNTGKCRYFHCSVCGYGVNDLFEACENGMPKYFEANQDWPFCPSCGADMREA